MFRPLKAFNFSAVYILTLFSSRHYLLLVEYVSATPAWTYHWFLVLLLICVNLRTWAAMELVL